MKDFKTGIKQSIEAFASGSLTANAVHLFQTLGYNTERQAPLDKPTYNSFKESWINIQSGFNETKALAAEWKYVDLLFQLSKEEVLKQTSLFNTKRVDRTAIEAYLFFTIELSGDHYSRTSLAHITREVNRLFAMPVMILFKYGTLLTLSVINRRLHKRDEGRDVLEKVTLIKDIQIQNPHRAHIEILFDLSFDELKDKYSFTNFVELHTAWQKTLDTKELNKRFYRELANWYFWAVQNVEFPADTATERDVRNATNVIRLITRLIFVWFLKEKGLIPDELFNRNRLQQILNYTDDNNSTYYKAILQNLFFATLNTEMGKRQFRNRAKKTGDRDQHYMIHNVFRYEDYFAAPDETLKKYFSNIPFLNGGLFECLDRAADKKIVRIDGFSDRKDNVLRVPDELFFSDEQEIDLNNVYGTKNKTYRARGIINLLNSYKFTIDENTPVEEEVALDPELLGKVFENLLASYNPETGSTARKQTGSFYTPREIVNYMVDESLIAYLQTKLASSSGIIPSPLTGEGQGGGEQRLRHLLSYTDEPHQFNPNEVDILIDAIDSAKILDPACGSGAFPMGILHKLVYILSKLDPNNQKWRQRQINKVMEVPDVTVREKLIEDIEQAFQSNELDYGRKLYLIENAIFGVDIQPIAVQIAKLRFFISLIVNQKTLSTNPPFEKGGSGGILNLGIRPLPNLETKFVAANTLIGIEKPQQLTLRNPDIDKKEAELKKIRERHFTARTPQTKEKYRKEDERLRTEIAEMLRNDGFPAGVTKKLAEWNPYDQNTSAEFFDPEWMFGITSNCSLTKGDKGGCGGFDIVIGNPPYVRADSPDPKHLEFRKKIEASKAYRSLYEKWDLFVPFIEKGINLLNPDGVLSYITSNSLCTSKFAHKLLDIIQQENIVRNIDYFEDMQVFKDIGVVPVVISIAKSVTDTTKPMKIIRQGYFANIRKKDIYDTSEFKKIGRDAFRKDYQKLKSNTEICKFGDICYISYGLRPNSDERFWKGEFTRDDLVSETKDSTHPKAYVEGKLIKRYAIEKIMYLEWDTERVPKKLVRPTFPELYTRPKIMSGILTGAIFDDTGIVCNHSIVVFVRFIELAGVNNKSISGSLKKFNTLSRKELEEKSKNYDLKYLLAILNSKYANFYLNNHRRHRLENYFYPDDFKNLPIPVISREAQQPFITIVNQILAAKQHAPSSPLGKGGNREVDTSALERQIDEMVYKLYNLTPEEIAIVEGGNAVK